MEVYKSVIGYEGLYEVSNLGNVKSLSRVVASRPGVTQHLKEKVLKPVPNKFGYHRLTLCKNSIVTNMSIHRLVAQAFLPRIAGKTWVNHIDSNPGNNCVSNLEWCTSKENSDHMVRSGRCNPKKGEAHPYAILSAATVKDLRAKYALGISSWKLGKEYGLNPNHVLDIVNRKIWKSV